MRKRLQWGRFAALGAAGVLACGALAYFAWPEKPSPLPRLASPPASAAARNTAPQNTPPLNTGPRDAAPPSTGTGVFLLADLFPSAAYVINTTDGLVLVDTGQESDCSKLLPLVERIGLDIRHLKIILLTHCHGDHVNGAQKLRALTGATVYAGQGDCDVLRAGGPWTAFFSVFDIEPGVTIHPTTIDVELLGGETIVLGDVQIDVLATPGHTPGSMCYLMRRGDGPRILFSGDVIMSYDSLGTYSAFLSPKFRGDAKQYLATLRMLSEMQPPDLVMPGHPRMTHSDTASARVEPEAWRASMGGGITLMMDLIKNYETNGRDFLDGQPRELLPGLVYLGDVAGRALYCLADDRTVTLFDAPGGSELVGVLETRLAEQGLDLANLRQVLLTSCDADATSGLALLVARTGCRVVAADAGLKLLRPQLPDGTVLLAAENLADDEGQLARGLPLAGLGVAPVAYGFDLAGKRMLVSGRLPIDPYDDEEHPWSSDPTAPGTAEYRRTLKTLSEREPDVWLPAVPWARTTRNANLYDGDWKRMIESNLKMLEPELP